MFAHFVRTLWAAPSTEQLGRAFVTGFRRVVDAPMYGLELPTGWASANVSDAFLARLPRDDPIRAQAATGKPTLVPGERNAACALHRIRHLVWVDGTFFMASRRAFGAGEIELARAVAGVLADVQAQLAERERRDRERRQALAALELTGAAVVTSDPHVTRNPAAQELLAGVRDAEAALHELLARPAGVAAYSRRVEVALAGGGTGVLHVRAATVDGGLTAVLELQREQPGIAPERLAALTARETDVARLVVDGLADREIAARLYLSPHTVSQHLKRVYRKLDVDSRVSLTRLLLGGAPTR